MSEWISVKDRLPMGTTFYRHDVRDYVLVSDNKGRMSVAYVFLNSTGNPQWTMAKPIGIVTHWMSLPAAPTEATLEREEV